MVTSLVVAAGVVGFVERSHDAAFRMIASAQERAMIAARAGRRVRRASDSERAFGRDIARAWEDEKRSRLRLWTPEGKEPPFIRG